MEFRGNGIEIHYDFSGPEQADVVTLSHALMADGRMWDQQLKSLESFRVLRYDLRGHGQSGCSGAPYDFNLLADDLRALWDHLKIDCTHFVGASLGGMIGLEIATTTPERIASLTLCGTRGNGASSNRTDSRDERIEVLQSQGVSALVDSVLSDWFSDRFRKKSSDAVKLATEMIEGTSVDGVIGCTKAIEAQDHLPLIPSIKLPCLIAAGEEDLTTPIKEAFDLHVGIDGSDMVVIPKTRHLANVEAADVFNDVLLTFLKQYS